MANAWADDAYNPHSTFQPRAPALEGSFPSPTRVRRALGLPSDERRTTQSSYRTYTHVANSPANIVPDLSFLEVHARALLADQASARHSLAGHAGSVFVI